MIELTEWFARAELPVRPWLVLGKGPTFDRRGQFDLMSYNRLALNHAVNEIAVDVAHIIDVDVVGDCAERLAQNCRWLVMPRHPHVRSRPSDRALEDWFGDYPVLAELDRQDRLVWYNLSGGPVHGRSPVIGAKRFSSEAALRILGLLGVRTIRSLGIDGGRSYGSAFRHLAETMLENGATSFDEQFERLEVIVAELGIDYRPLLEPLRIFLGTESSQIVAHRVLEYSIRASSSVPVEVVPMLNLPHPVPRDPENRPRTTFSFCRFMIPELCAYRGHALYLDADMLVFSDIAELADMPFGDHTVLCSAPPPTGSWDGRGAAYLGSRSVAVMLLDCDRLRWKIDEIVAGLDEKRYTYAELLSDVCVVQPAEIADTIPPEWNELERYQPGRTKLLHYTVVPTQPWKNDENPLAELWMGWYREAVEAGAVPPEEVEELVRAGLVKPSLTAALRRAPSRRSVVTAASLDLDAARRRIAQLEARVSSMERSWPWRIGTSIVGAARVPRDLVRHAPGPASAEPVTSVRSLGARANTVLRDRLRIEVRRIPVTPPARRLPKLAPDPVFDRLYLAGARRADHDFVKGRYQRHDRKYNLVQLLRMTEGVPGLVGECGSFKGHSAYLLCQYLLLEQPNFAGRGVHLFDSFEGLSQPTPEDNIEAAAGDGGPESFGGHRGDYLGTLDQVRHTLEEFPDVDYHVGWIPDCFATAPDGPWRLVHVDVDLYQPTRDALEHFYPRLAPGGVLVCDDYGFHAWPGARKAVEELSAAVRAPTFRVSSGQAILFAPPLR